MRPLVLAAAVVACHPDPVFDPPLDAPTWHADVAPLVAAHCSACHTEGAIAGSIPFDSYPEAEPFAALMAARTASREMPPFPAEVTEECPNPWGWTHDRRLTDDEIATFAAWSDAGAPAGDPAEAVLLPDPPLPTPVRADQRIAAAAPFVVPSRTEAADTFVCLVIDPELAEDGMLEASRVVPDALGVVHHVVLHADAARASDALVGPDGWYPCTGGPIVATSLVGGWVPGGQPFVTPPGTAVRVPAGSRMIVEMHYHGASEPTPDATAIELQWADGPRIEAYVELFGNAGRADAGLEPGPADRTSEPEFRIPAGATSHTETMRFPLDQGGADVSYGVFQTLNHMHRIGTRMRSWVETADGDPVCLLDTPRWDFDWQLFYGYDLAAGRAPVVRGGDTLVLECTYDNTLANRGTREALAEQGLTAPIDVSLGEGTLDEMCVFVVGVVPL